MNSGSESIVNMMDGYKNSFILAAAMKLDLFQKISLKESNKEECSIVDLASDCIVKVEPLRRLLKVLESLKFVYVNDTHVILGTRGLRIINDPELYIYLTVSSFDWIGAWSDLEAVMVLGKHSDGITWNNRAKQPSLDFAFQLLMVYTQPKTIDFPVDIAENGTVVDVGGGIGFTLGLILEQHPKMNGILFERANVIEMAKDNALSKLSTMGRCQFASGDFTNEVPSGGDLYILSNILHDWNDDFAAWILNRCFKAMGFGSKLILTETFIPESGNDPYASITDLHLMVVHGGRKRTLSEYKTMLYEAGFYSVSSGSDYIEVLK